MNFAAVRNLNRVGLRNLRFFHTSRKRANEPPKDRCSCETEKPPEPPCPPKAPEPPPKFESSAPQPPPCPSMPQCPPTMCPPFPDPNNPCNYCPPPCIDPDYPNLKKLKANQCRFQVEDDVPIFLKKGTVDVILFQVTVVIIVVVFGITVYLGCKSQSNE